MARKILFCKIVCFFLFFVCLKVNATTIDEVIKQNPQFNNAIIAISVKDAKTNNIIYQKNEKKLLHPASTLKLITSFVALDYLGSDYSFDTAFYKNGQDLYLKIGADPLFKYSDMQNLVAQYKTKNQGTIKNLYIDDTIIDKVPYGIGWQWDDNTNVHFPQISPYIINDNLFYVKATINKNKILIQNAIEYSEPIKNNLKLGEKKAITVTRDMFSNQTVNINGTIKEPTMISIPAKNPQLMFNNILGYTFLQNQIPFNAHFKYAQLPRFSAKEAIISHSLQDVLKEINQNSNNLAAEILIKHLANAKTEKTGTTKDGLEVVKNFYIQNYVDMQNICLVDASGASMNDYVTADFMTNALFVIRNSNNFDIIENSLSDTNKGTFKGRLPELAGKVKAKTGTLANTSAVIGYIKTSSGRDLTFAILLDNMPFGINAKEMENNLLKAIYKL